MLVAWLELVSLSSLVASCFCCLLQDTLVEQLELCVDYLWKSERHELIADINKPVIAVFEKRRDFKVAIKPCTLWVCVFVCP